MPTLSDEFVLVTRKKSNKIKLKKVAVTEEDERTRKFDFDVVTCILDSTQRLVSEVREAKYTKNVIEHLQECLTVLQSDTISEIVCYGLGRFSVKKPSKYQLGLLLCLQKHYGCIPVYIYDPLFYPEERKILEDLGLEVIKKNEEGKRIVHQDKTTLVYMPHCHFYLTNNFLYANWSSGLSNCIVLANSFSETINFCPAHVLKPADYLLRIGPYVTEIKLKDTWEFEFACNNINIHIFSKEKLLEVPTDFWTSREEPQYLIDCGDFVTISEQ